MTRLHPVRAHVRRSPSKPRVYLDIHETLYDEVYGRILVQALESALADLAAEIEREAA